MSWEEQQQYDKNFSKVVLQGRNPSLDLWQQGHSRLMADWLEELFADFSLLAKSLDQHSTQTNAYHEHINELYPAVLNPELTLSGQIMSILNENNWDFSRLGMDLAHKYRDQLSQEALEYYQESDFEQWRKASEEAFVARKINDNVVDFDTFLSNYFKQAARSGKADNSDQ